MPNSDPSNIPEPNIVKLRSLLEGAPIAMLTSVDADGALSSRPMALQELDSDGALWFFTGLHTHVTSEIGKDARLNVSVVHDSTYVSMCGTGMLVDDPKKASELWKPVFKAWFPKGLEDPDLALIKVLVDRAEYWDNPGGVVTTLIGYVKSVATGQMAKVGEHGELGVGHHSVAKG